ncbi:hypothetical protein FACS1894151_03010 [Spirochaetia bacterium]|nr:hypothetical protein FACS1894151_03010 [Spirochaetia bacterium]
MAHGKIFSKETYEGFGNGDDSAPGTFSAKSGTGRPRGRVLALGAAAAIALTTLVMPLTGCKQPTGSEIGEPGQGEPEKPTPTHTHTYPDAVWPDGTEGAVWTYVTEMVSGNNPGEEGVMRLVGVRTLIQECTGADCTETRELTQTHLENPLLDGGAEPIPVGKDMVALDHFPGYEFVDRELTTGPTMTELPNPTSITNFGKNTGTLDRVSGSNAADPRVSTISSENAVGLSSKVLLDLSQQAKALAEFFDGATVATDDTTGLQAKFDAIKNSETTIRGTGTNSINQFFPRMEAQTGNIVNTIFTDPTEFNKYLDAYQKLHYMMTRDWQTGTDAATNAQNAVNDFKDALDGLTGIEASAAETINIGPGSGLTVPANWSNINRDLETAMKTQIIAALGLVTVSNADKMAEALIYQLQDTEELRALKTDLENKGYDIILNRQSDLAQVGTQSSDIKLASVNAEFPHDGVKTGSRGKYDLYTGNFTPLNRKDEKGMA